MVPIRVGGSPPVPAPGPGSRREDRRRSRPREGTTRPLLSRLSPSLLRWLSYLFAPPRRAGPRAAGLPSGPFQVAIHLRPRPVPEVAALVQVAAVAEQAPHLPALVVVVNDEAPA